MATATFDKKIEVKNNESMDTLLKGLSENSTIVKKIDVISELDRSSSILRRLSSRSKV
jgi:hypothetical protein